MHWIDWCITVIPVLLVLWLAVYSKRYVRGVVDFLAAGRVAGRYVIAVGDLASGLAVITLIGMSEQNYQTGFGLNFWNIITVPVTVLLSLTGFCLYRFRETKALSMGQFLEMRYNRTFRIFAATLRTLAEMLTNAIGPAVAARFFIYFLGFPQYVTVCGWKIQTFMFVVLIVLLMALVVMWTGGRISLLITDSIQALLSYPIFVIILGWIILRFSWTEEIAPVMMDRAKGESFFNPFDIENLRSFNIFSCVTLLISSILNRASWIGNDVSSSGRTPHEQKMAGILGAWRNGFSQIMMTMIAMILVVVMTYRGFSAEARGIRCELSDKVAEEVFESQAVRDQLRQAIDAIPEQKHIIGVDAPLSQENNIDKVYFDKAHDIIGKDGTGNYLFKQYQSLFRQQMVSVTLRRMLPVGLAGVFCLLMVMLMLSTDDSRIFNSSSTIVQDIILPFCKNPLTPQQHLRLLKGCSLAVCVFFFVCSMLFAQLDYINMFINIMAAIWIGGAGPVMVFGLYSRFGNVAGAYASLFVGSGISCGCAICQSFWPKYIYPYLLHNGLVGKADHILRTLSAPFEPIVVWRVDPVNPPVNSYEALFLALVFGTVAYVVVSLIAYRKPYNLDRLLHRGKYAIDGERNIKTKWSLKTVFVNIIGITPEYTGSDRFIAWMVFLYSFGFELMISFVLVLVWNAVKFLPEGMRPWQPWPDSWWSYYYLIVFLIVPSIVGVISTVWFMWGGIRDTVRLFRDLALRVDNPLDNGTVVGQVSLADAEVFKRQHISDDEEK